MLHAGQRQLIALLNAHLERGKLGLADDGGTDALVLGDGVVVEHVEGNEVLAEVHISEGEILAPLKERRVRQSEHRDSTRTTGSRHFGMTLVWALCLPTKIFT